LIAFFLSVTFLGEQYMSKKRTSASSQSGEQIAENEGVIVKFLKNDEDLNELDPVPTPSQLRKFKRLGMSAIEFHSKEILNKSKPRKAK
jgi:hypothetical protein